MAICRRTAEEKTSTAPSAALSTTQRLATAEPPAVQTTGKKIQKGKKIPSRPPSRLQHLPHIPKRNLKVQTYCSLPRINSQQLFLQPSFTFFQEEKKGPIMNYSPTPAHLDPSFTPNQNTAHLSSLRKDTLEYANLLQLLHQSNFTGTQSPPD
ncbi:hypothetical protein AVEN_200324-1 [Araneus ventricosus]|uniref:Uncharacterized protein n=1 Tax=Araneus ventricosus TaxID=182803 RepID=A0A4Y2GTR2_ARAVE|nr:hypothetical protein AVEN_200324-1 [Araneus ventricosus]